ncbi:MAG: carbohydrate ABC transporter permease, partial [Pirellulaceae bacterium]
MRQKKRRRRSQTVGRAAAWTALAIGAAVMLFPFVWMVSTACKPTEELLEYGLNLFPKRWACVENLNELFATTPLFGRYMLNTAIVTVVRTVGQFFLTTLAAYGFARYEFPFKRTLFIAALAILMVPGQAIVIPQFAIIRQLGLFGTVAGIALPNIASAFSLFLFRQAFLQIPVEYEEAAAIDGAGPLRILYMITVPMAKAAVAAFIIISFIA